MRHTGTIVAITALLAVALAPVASAQVISNSSFPLVVGPYFQMRNSADNSFWLVPSKNVHHIDI
jgi:hypothetical protein